MSQLHRIAERMINCPLLLHPGKAQVIFSALSERFGIHEAQMEAMEVEMAAEFNTAGRNGRKVGYDVVEGVALIEVDGSLVQRLGSLRPYSGMTGYDGIRQNFLTAIADPDVKAICLDISSPGGEVSGCFDLVDTIFEARGTKPIWSILSESAYSAGYAIASAADKIIVPRTGGVGSIGVIAMHVDYSKAIAGAGMEVTIIKYGERKADGASEKPLSANALVDFQSDIDTMGELFVSTVARNRNLSPETVKDTQARCYLGEQGVAVGLADEVMPPDAAFFALLKTLG